MADGRAQLRAQVARLRALESLPRRAAPLVARELEEELRGQIAKGVGPDGTPWELTKDGRRALPNAGRDLRVSAVGDVVVASLTGHIARHHLGAVRGGVRRQILPTNALPNAMARAIAAVVEHEFARTMGVG